MKPLVRHNGHLLEPDTLRVWDVDQLTEVARFTADGSLHSCAISSDGGYVLAGDIAGHVHFLQLWE